MPHSSGHAWEDAPPDVFRLHNGREVFIRALREEDEVLYPDFDHSRTDEDRRLRYFSHRPELGAAMIFKLTHFDRLHGTAFIALDKQTGAMLGVGRLHHTTGDEGEFAVSVRSDLKGQGLGYELMRRLLAVARRLDIGQVVGFILRENTGMLSLCRDLGFKIEPVPDEIGVVLARRDAPVIPVE